MCQADIFLTVCQADIFLTVCQADIFLTVCQADIFLTVCQVEVVTMVQCLIHRNSKVIMHHQGSMKVIRGLLRYDDFYIHYTKLSFTYSRNHTFYFVSLALGTPSVFSSFDLWAP